MADKFEPINIEGQQQTGIWVHHPGSGVSQTWEPRKGKSRHPGTQIQREGNSSIGSDQSAAVTSHQDYDSSSSDENPEGSRLSPLNAIRRRLRKITAGFHKSPRKVESNNAGEAIPSHVNLRAVNDKSTGVKLIIDDNICREVAAKDPKADKGSSSPESSGPESPGKGNMKGMAKSILKHAERSAHGLKHAFSRKESNKSKEDSRVSTEMDILQESNSSDEESLSSSKECTPRIDGIPIDSTPILEHGNESPNMREQNSSHCDSGMNSEEPPVRDISSQGVERGI